MNRYFEDFAGGEEILHPTPRTLTEGEVALNFALYGGRFGVNSSVEFAKNLGLSARPICEVLVFNIIFGKSVADISYNAVANLGYAQGRFLAPVFCGDTLRAQSEVLGLRENKNGKSGIVLVATQGFNQNNICVLEYIRWVMIKKREINKQTEHQAELTMPEPVVGVEKLIAPELDFSKKDFAASGSERCYEDYTVGERLEHQGATTLDPDHTLATRLYQNTASVHFDEYNNQQRLIYGGHIIAHARAMSFDGLANSQLAAINAGTHAAPAYVGDTIFAASEIIAKQETSSKNLGAVRVRHLVAKNAPLSDFAAGGELPDSIILDLDVWLWLPKHVK